MFEGFRLNDLKHWKKMEFTDRETNADIDRGAWIKKADYTALYADVRIGNGAAKGYIIPAPAASSRRRFTDRNVYLGPIPPDQIKHDETLA